MSGRKSRSTILGIRFMAAVFVSVKLIRKLTAWRTRRVNRLESILRKEASGRNVGLSGASIWRISAK